MVAPNYSAQRQALAKQIGLRWYVQAHVETFRQYRAAVVTAEADFAPWLQGGSTRR
jgi:hypothetical protein